MVGGLIADSRQRQKVFDRRAESVLKQARELSVLCDVPACVVIYNPDDAIKPWRIWPESDAELRNVIEFYKTKVGSGSTTAASDGGVANGVTTVDLGGKIESRMDANQSNLVVVQEPPRTDVNNCRLAGKDLCERFDINEFLNFRECELCDDTLFEKETEAAATSSSSMQQAVGSKTKRKAPVRVCNFEEPVMMSSQRRRLN
ncbi:unnamed protein product [Rhodiola kirilowii]